MTPGDIYEKTLLSSVLKIQSSDYWVLGVLFFHHISKCVKYVSMVCFRLGMPRILEQHCAMRQFITYEETDFH